MVQKRRWQGEGPLAELPATSVLNQFQQSSGIAACNPVKRHQASHPLEASVPSQEQPDEGAMVFLRELANCSAAGGQFQGDLRCLLNQGHSPGLREEHWLCCAELNLLFQRHFSSLAASSLRSYHSFTRQEPGQLWQRLTQALMGTGSTLYRVDAMHAPVHVQMLNTLISLLPYPAMGAVRYTFVRPPWLFGWANKWRHCLPELSVVELQCYPVQPGVPSSSTPARVLYVPVFA